MTALQVLRDKFGGSALFAREKDESFKSTMGAICQTFGGRYLRASRKKRASLLYHLTIKNHSFATAANASRRSCSSGSWRTTASSTA